MKIALTGGSGFLGKELTRQLIESGDDVYHLLRQSSREPSQGSVSRVDFEDINLLKQSLEGKDVLIHAIGLVNGSTQDLHDINVSLTEKLMQALPQNIKKVIFISSAAAAMRKGPYGEAKLEAEKIVQQCGRPWVILRPTLIYGPGDNKNLQMMIDWVTKRPVVPVLGGGHFKVQPVHIEDVASAIVESCHREVNEKIFNICGPEQVSLRHMLEELKQRTKSRCLFLSVPLKPVQRALKLWSVLWPWTRLPVKQVLELDKHEAFEFSATKESLGFSPRRFDEGLDWI